MPNILSMPSTRSSPVVINFAMSSVMLPVPPPTSLKEIPFERRVDVSLSAFSMNPSEMMQKGPNFELR